MASASNVARGKKLINSVSGCVDDSLAGMVAVHNHLRLLPDHRVVVRSDFRKVVDDGRVCVVSGGGSGHEPALAGFVGLGMLTAAIAGDVFASPPSTHILEALRLLRNNNTAGALLVVANYTGDRLNFGLAAEQAKSEGQRVETVYVADDCALVSSDKSAGRRGLSGIQITIKIAGALAEEGKPLEFILETLKYVAANLGSIGLSLTPCSLPGSGPNFHLADDEMELGLGVHGEAGVSRIKLRSAEETINLMLSHMTNPQSASCLQFSAGDRVALLVNNLGGTSNLEMNIICLEAITWLESRQVEVCRVYAAPVMTSLEMAGITLTIIRVNDVTLTCLDAEASAPGWFPSHQVIGGGVPRSRTLSTILQVKDSSTSSGIGKQHYQNTEEFQLDQNSAGRWTAAITSACNALIASRDVLNDLDSGCGDGDCGSTLGQGAQVVLAALKDGSMDVTRPANALRHLATLCQTNMGGCSGAVYAIFFSAVSASLTAASPEAWARALRRGMEAVIKYGGAEPGDRTLLDALCGPIAKLEKNDSAIAKKDVNSKLILEDVALSAEEGAQATAEMKAKAGRASYVNAALCNRCDPGAKAVAIIFRAVAQAFKD